MSKIDAQRAMWKQRYERRQAAAAAQPASAALSPPVAPPAHPRTSVTEAPAPAAVLSGADMTEPVEELCGHRNMGGRTCTRERGHAAKSHRYS
jgi:hypothetical protein